MVEIPIPPCPFIRFFILFWKRANVWERSLMTSLVFWLFLTYLVLLYNVPFLGLSWIPLPTLIRDVINERSLSFFLSFLMFCLYYIVASEQNSNFFLTSFPFYYHSRLFSNFYVCTYFSEEQLELFVKGLKIFCLTALHCALLDALARDIHIKCSKQFKWNPYFYVSGKSWPFWAALKLL